MIITFEGIDGAGKTTQIKHLMTVLKKNNIDAVCIREPGGCEISEKIRTLLLCHNTHISDITEVLLFSASRAELFNTVVKHALSYNDIVVIDRFSDSLLAYQGYGRGIDLNIINQLINISLNTTDVNRIIDLTFLIDIPITEAYKRIKQKNINDRIESAGDDFFTSVRNGYLKIASDNPMRVKVINGLSDETAITNIIWNSVLNYINVH